MSLRPKLRKALQLLTGKGWQEISLRLSRRRARRTYQRWIQKHDSLSDEDRRQIKVRIANLQLKPLISVVMPVYNVEERWLRLAIESVQKQLYPHWELCIADDCSPSPHIRRMLTEYARQDSRIKIVFRSENGHISAASNSALKLATGDFVALLDHDDELAEQALYWVAEEINNYPESNLIYSDEDKIDQRGHRYDPAFKPDWSPDLFYSLNFVNHLSVYRAAVLREIGGFRFGYEGSQDYDLVLRVIEQISVEQIRHIPRILYHWRAIRGSIALSTDQKDYAHERARQAIQSHFARTKVKADVAVGFANLHRAVYYLPDSKPMVSVILLGNEFTNQTVESILQQTVYGSFELIVVKRKSDSMQLDSKLVGGCLRIVETEATTAAGAFNFAAWRTTGEILIFFASGLLVQTTDWMRELASHAWRSEIGAVGSKTLFSTGYIKQAGLILGIKNGIGYAHHGLPNTQPGHLVRAQVIQNLSAVSAECLTICHSVFAQAKGFDEQNVPTKYFAADLCLRLQEEFGMRVIWTPYVQLRQSQRYEKSFRKKFIDGSVEAELSYLKNRWKTRFEDDPFYNPNLTVHREDFSLDV